MKKETLTPEILTDYFQVNQTDLDNFQKDFFLPIADNSYFEM